MPCPRCGHVLCERSCETTSETCSMVCPSCYAELAVKLATITRTPVEAYF